MGPLVYLPCDLIECVIGEDDKEGEDGRSDEPH